MLVIEVEYLLGRAVATDVSQRDLAEWPPHPTRLFSALVDALSDVTEESAHRRGEAALRWLERQPAPQIAASADAVDVSKRTVVKHFVPINDDVAEAKNMRSTPLVEQRTRQERFFPSVVPADPRVVFAWQESTPSEEQAVALGDLVARVFYLGHSSSIVRVACMREAPPPATLTPSEGGELLLRVPGPGRLDRLNAVHQVRMTNTLVQPPKGRELRYGRIDARPAAHGPHGTMRVLALTGNQFGLVETAWLTSRLRAALLSNLPSGRACPEVLCGHAADGKPSLKPHIAFVPLANVAHGDETFADGAVKGLGVLLPRDLDGSALVLLDTALARLQRLVFGERGEAWVRELPAVETADRAEGGRLFSLKAARYTKPSKTWVTVTPIVLGLHPKPKKGLTAESIVAAHVRELGLPEPMSLILRDVSDLWGSAPARTYHRGDIKALAGRMLRHAVIEFSEPVAGPLVVGAARHMGFGLLLPRGGRDEVQ